MDANSREFQNDKHSRSLASIRGHSDLPICRAAFPYSGHTRRMKPILTLLILLGLYCNSSATIPFAQGRRIQELNVISTRTLQRSISPRFYRSLCVSPIQGLIVIRANLVDTHLSGIRLIHSELDGRFDQLALKLAKDQIIA